MHVPCRVHHGANREENNHKKFNTLFTVKLDEFSVYANTIYKYMDYSI